MYFSRLTFNPLVSHQQLAQTLCQDTYREHQALWQLFATDPDAARDFLYRQVIEQGRIKYYVLSERIPVDRSGMWLMDTPKPYDPKLVEGQRLFFTLRANPVVTVATAEGKKLRHDAVMNAKKQMGFDALPPADRPPLQQLVQDSCVPWLQARAESNGFSVAPELVTVDGYQQYESYAKQQKRPVRYSTVDFQGILMVTDSAKFKSALFNGIGKAKAFGCGLLLVKRV
jgi:CRISPR system Cascade subunit CasE